VLLWYFFGYFLLIIFLIINLVIFPYLTVVETSTFCAQIIIKANAVDVRKELFSLENS